MAQRPVFRGSYRQISRRRRGFHPSSQRGKLEMAWTNPSAPPGDLGVLGRRLLSCHQLAQPIAFLATDCRTQCLTWQNEHHHLAHWKCVRRRGKEVCFCMPKGGRRVHTDGERRSLFWHLLEALPKNLPFPVQSHPTRVGFAVVRDGTGSRADWHKCLQHEQSPRCDCQIAEGNGPKPRLIQCRAELWKPAVWQSHRPSRPCIVAQLERPICTPA